jgi:hypothetical protein
LPLLVFAATWLLILAAWYGSDAVYGRSRPWTWHFLIRDANFYLGIAEHGYTGDPARAAFFPLFPLLIHLTSYLTGGDYPVAGLITSVACGAASAVAVWALASQACDRWVADRAVVLYCAFPGAMTFGILYSEPLAVALGAAALLALLDRRWLLAGIIGAVATAERPSMIILIVASGVAALQAIRDRREWRSLIAPLLTPLGVLAYFGYLGRRHHDYGYWFWIEQKGWHQHIDWGLHTLRVLLWLYPREARHWLYVALLLITFAAAVAGIALMLAARLPLPVTVFGLLTIVLAVISSDGAPSRGWCGSRSPSSSAPPRNCHGPCTGRCSSCRPWAWFSSPECGRITSPGPHHGPPPEPFWAARAGVRPSLLAGGSRRPG